METLQDWKTALASGVKIDTLLGLDKAKSQTTKSNDQLPAGADMATTNDKQHDLNVKTSDGQLLEFQWSTPSLSSICPDVSGSGTGESKSSIPSTMMVTQPSIPVKQILGPCFIDLSTGHDEDDQQGKVSNYKENPSPD